MITSAVRTSAIVAFFATLGLAAPAPSGNPGHTGASAARPPRDVTYFLRQLRTPDHLPELEHSHTAMSSTWDRSGGNFDGWDFKRIERGPGEEGGRNILLDVEGPGCIHRMFTGWLGEGKDILGKLGPAGTRMQVFLDGAEQPVFDMPVERFFDDRDGPFRYPLVFHKTYPGILFPIPFAEHCRVQLFNPDAPAWGNFWQITYTTYSSDVQVESLTWPLSAAEAQELQLVREAWLEAESRQPATPAEWTELREFPLPSGQAEEIRLEGCGVIQQMRVGVTMATPEVLRGIRMQIRWDGSDEPSVDVPLGYFFGNADYAYLNEIHFNSLLLGVTPSEAYSCFPMPFQDGAVLRFENRADQGAFKVRVCLDVQRRQALPDNWGRLHVTWNERRAALPDAPRFGPQNIASHLVLEREGPGKYVGVLLHVQWPHTDWWGEGDWLIWTDEDDWPPRYHGTGSEEYFNSGWCSFDRKAVSGYVKTRPGDVALYSFHLNDAFQFQRNIRVAEETVGMDALWMKGETIIHRDNPIWSSTAYWYALPVQAAESTELIPRGEKTP
jgi:hypothetical protein